MNISENSWSKENRSIYRILKFITSVRGQKKLWGLFFKVIIYVIKKITGINLSVSRDYKIWMKENFPTQLEIEEYRTKEKVFAFRPKISIILPVYNPPEQFLKEAIQSVIDQAYSNWELCIADDFSTNKNIAEIINSFAQEDNRIKVVFRKENGHISAASNSAIAISTGDYIGLFDHDDLLTPDALYENVIALNQQNNLDIIYSDEDKVDENGNFSGPHFKPDWCPDNFLSRNYICHFTVIKSALVKEVGGFREGYEGSQDYDLFLRVTEKTNNIYHIPKVLYHWRMHNVSTAMDMNSKPYAIEAGIKSLQEALIRRKLSGKIKLIGNLPGFYSVRYAINEKKKVSVIIPTKDKSALTDVCISSIFELTSYTNFEIILMNNNSTEASFFKMVKKWEEKEPNRFKCISYDGDFNFSILMNKSVKEATGEYLLLLNNDTEVIHKDWMEAMVEQAQRKEIGAVGVKLLYKNDTVQHAGVIIGLRGIAGHPFVGKDKNDLGYFNYLVSISNFSAVTAACLMVRKEVYNEVNGFDEGLAIEFNDVDFCLRLKEKGYNNIYLPHVNLYHYESISRGHPHKTKESHERSIKEGKLFQERWKEYIDNDPCYNRNLSLVYDDFRIKA
ncbi:MAG: glycosyltransferase family 2 protein [Vicingus serpentipes]|nr:glycosyltransferase family 2 protein [Vicingus serpentipes]